MLAEGRSTSLRRTMTMAFQGLIGTERDMLSPYIARIRLGLPEIQGTCPVTSLTSSVFYFVACCPSDFKPSEATWRAILLFHTNAGCMVFRWVDVRDAAWTLQTLHVEGRQGHTGEHWRALHFFFFLVGIHRSQKCGNVPNYAIKDVRSLLRIVEGGDSTESLQGDTATKLFLSAAVHLLELTDGTESLTEHHRSQRLLNHTTDEAQLKKDAEGLWLDAMELDSQRAGSFVIEHLYQ
jgi:hypothetical protein